MNLRSRAALCLLITGLFVSGARAQVFTPLPPEVWPDIVDTPLQPSDIIVELRYRNWLAAWRIAKDLAIIHARQEVHDYFHSKVKMTKLAATLNKILDDPGKTDVQKADELLMLTDASFEPSTSAPTGALNVTMKHSIELGVTRLEWDDKVRNGSQSGGRVTGQCTYGSSYSCSWGGTYSTCYYRAQPDYFIYRIVNDEETLITIMKGFHASSGSSSIAFSDNLWKSAWEVAKYYYETVLSGNYPNVVPGRAFFYDFQADMRPPGSTLSYRVVTFDDWLFPVVNGATACGAATGGSHATTVSADANGDGRMDYLTNADYSKYFGKYFGWLPAVIGSVLE